MTISSTDSRKSYAGNGVTTSFGTSPVVFFTSADLKVYVVVTATGAATLLTENTDYTVTGGDGSTGTIDTSTGSSPYGAPSALQTLLIVRDVAITQLTDFVNNDASDAEVAEDVVDKLTMIAQQLDSRLDRSFVLADSDVSGASTELPTPSGTTLLGWNSAGTALQNYTAAALSLALVSSYIATLLDDVDAATARQTLGAPAATDGTLVRPTLTNPIQTSQALTDGATINWDANSGAFATVTLGGNRTLAAPTNLKVGQYVLLVTQDGTGGRTLTWNAVFKGKFGAAMPQPTPVASAVTAFVFACNGTNLYLVNCDKQPVTQVFTGSGTYTPTAGMTYCDAEVQAPGGGSGGCSTTGGSQISGSGAGGGGGYAKRRLTAAQIGVSQVVTIGAVGAAGAAGANSGGTGGTTSLGALLSATGGAGGGVTGAVAQSYAAGGAGGVGSSGDINLTGGGGGQGGGGNSIGYGGAGGASRLGGGGNSTAAAGAVAAVAGGSYGGGASGGALGQSQSQIAGAAGGPGIIVVTEYFS